MNSNDPTLCCSFCGIEKERVERLFLGPGVAICDVCVASCCGPFDENEQQAKIVEPEQLAAAMSKGMGWGRINVGAATRAGFCCEYCGARFLSSVQEYYLWQIDHIVPGAGDDLDNSALACHVCNHLKHTYRPSGSNREERLIDAKREIARKRAKKLAELQSLRKIVGLPPLIA